MTTYSPRGAAESPTGSSPEDAAQEIAQFGSTVLRDVWAPEDLATLHGAITGFCDRRAELVASGAAPPMMAQYHAQGSVLLNWLIFEGRIDLEFFARMFAGSFYHEICKAHFGGDQFYLAPDFIASRNMRPPHSAQQALPYHQDSYSQDRRVLRVLNCWIPLDPGAGVTSPGVEVVRHPGRPKFERKGAAGASIDAGYDPITIDRERIIAEYGDNFLSPEFQVGDSLVFSEHVIHRTFVTPRMDQPRIGFEFRVFSMNHLAPWASADELEPECFPLV